VKRTHLIISGRVQGVGFRYFCMEQAEGLGLTGYARNQTDGTVEVEAQGAEDKLEEFIRALHEGPRLAQITEIQREDRPAVSRETEFEVR
jgi:acylphosphatase